MKALKTTTAVILVICALAAMWFALQANLFGGEPFVVLNIKTNHTVPKVKTVKMPDDVTQRAPSRNQTAQNQKGDNVELRPKSAGAEDSEGKVLQDGSIELVLKPPSQMPVSRNRAAIQRHLPSKNTDWNNGPSTMAPIPVKALVEYTHFGPLPKISEDGRLPSEVYARPSKLSSQFRAGEPPSIALLINGLGLSSVITHTAIEKLPGPVTLAFAPYGHNLQVWVRKARELGHEVMLQVPLEPFDYPDNDPGPHTLLTSLPSRENLNRLKWLMARFTGYTGITNAMGAKFTSAKESFRPVLMELKQRGLIYIEDGVSPRSTSKRLAGELGLGFGEAQIIIDAEHRSESIDQALNRLEVLAQERGVAIGVGSSLPVTIHRISKWAEALKKKGFKLIPISAAVRAMQRS